jgi:hypothetical protein
MIDYWINYWVSAVCWLTLGGVVGYLYREKKLWDHKKGKHGK